MAEKNKAQDILIQIDGTEVKRYDSGVSRLEALTFFLQNHTSLIKQYEQNSDKLEKKRNFWVKWYYVLLGFFQLRNGLRASEAIKSTFKSYYTKKRKFSIIALKHGLERPVVFPEIIEWYWFNKIMERVILIWQKEGKEININSPHRTNFEKKVLMSYDWFLKKTPIKNSHSLRYAWIRYMVEKGYPLHVIERILGHKRMGTTYHYAQQYDVSKVLETEEMKF